MPPHVPSIQFVDESDLRVARLRWPFVLLVWSVPALLAAFETFVFWRLNGRAYPFWRALEMEGPAWLTYAAFTPGIVALGRRLPVQRPRIGRHLLVHALAALVLGGVYALLATAFSRVFAPEPRATPVAAMLVRWYLSALPLTVLAYFAVLGVGTSMDHINKARRREMDAARLATQLAEARLGALRMQLHPHFLFNTLNAIAVLARDGDMPAVVRMLTLLSELLRDVLRSDATHDIPLAEELAFARRYLAIERVRFGERLRVREDADDDTLHLLVPAFILQPLIENALRHGVAPRVTGGTVRIASTLRGSSLELRVEDDGVGLGADWSGPDEYGVGLANTAARLAESYGAQGTLAVEVSATGGTLAVIRLPARPPVAASAGEWTPDGALAVAR